MDKNKPRRDNLIRFTLDILIFVGFLLSLDPRLTGIPIHEWLTMAGIAAIILHLLLDWNWIVGLTKKFFRKVAFKARLNYVLNWLFFIDGIVVMISGILVSEVILPLVGILPIGGHTWKTIHSVSADISLFILALHTALHWDWIVTVVKRYLLQPLRRPKTTKAEGVGQGEVQA